MGIYVSYSDRDTKSADASSGTPYNLKMINGSADNWTFYVYQNQPQLQSDIFSLAWFASPFVITPGNSITFSWDITFDFVWGQTGTIKPGVTFSAGGNIAADPATLNTTTFSHVPGPNFSPAVQVPPSGVLVINDDGSVPSNVQSVGIGMSGTGTYAVQAGPNLIHTFTPTPSYFVGAGQDIQIGTVLDIETITQTSEVLFPLNNFNAIATLGQNNLWTVDFS